MNKEFRPRGPGCELPLEGLDYAIRFKVPKMPKVNEFFISLKIDLAKGEYLNFSSL